MLKKCEKCGKFFGTEVQEQKNCSSCAQGESTGLGHIKDPREQRFIVARNLVYENPDISPENLVKKMKEMNIDIRIKDIMDFVREGRLTLKNSSVEEYCEDCGKKILSGRKCPSCTKEFESTLQQSRKEILEEDTSKKQGPRMYSQD